MLPILLRRAAPWACAWMLGLPLAHAAEPEASALFEHYQRWRDEPLQDWRAVNQRVGEVGGWRTYLRESQAEGSDAEGGARDGSSHDHHHGH